MSFIKKKTFLELLETPGKWSHHLYETEQAFVRILQPMKCPFLTNLNPDEMSNVFRTIP